MYTTNFWDRYTYMYIKRLDQYNLHVYTMCACAYIYIYIDMIVYNLESDFYMFLVEI